MKHIFFKLIFLLLIASTAMGQRVRTIQIPADTVTAARAGFHGIAVKNGKGYFIDDAGDLQQILTDSVAMSEVSGLGEVLDSARTDIGALDSRLVADSTRLNSEAINIDNLQSDVLNHDGRIEDLEGVSNVKNAANFGFKVSNSADDNYTALQAALSGGGVVTVTDSGTYELCNTVTIESNTTLIFGAGVTVSKAANSSGKYARFTFINEGAFTKTYNENITVDGLHLKTNGEGKGTDIDDIYGLRGQVSFFYVKDLNIYNFKVLDGEASTYVIHIARFENVKIDKIRVEGLKDAVHISAGKSLKISNGIFKTYDDPIALNAHDYVDGCPELGSIEDVVIENCYDLDDEQGTTGYFCRILAGSWVDWYSGMEIKRGDAVISGGRLYRSKNLADGTLYISTTAPTHTSGTETLNSIEWYMVQDENLVYKSEVKNVVFRDIYLEKTRPIYFSIHLDNDNYSRSYYPNSEVPTVSQIVLDNVIMKDTSTATFISTKANVNAISLTNCEIKNARILSLYLGTEGLDYDDLHLNLSNTVFSGSGTQTWVQNQSTKKTYIHEHNSSILNDTYVQENIGNVYYTESGHYHSNLSELENLDSKLDIPTLTSGKVGYWNGSTFANSVISVTENGRLGSLLLDNNRTISGRNSLGNSDFGLLKLGTDDNVYFNSNTLPNKVFFHTNNIKRLVIDENGSVGVGTDSPSVSAILDLTSTDKGALMPRMTSTQREAISSPANGLVVVDTDFNAQMMYDGTRWTGFRYNGTKFQGFDGSGWVDLN